MVAKDCSDRRDKDNAMTRGFTCSAFDLLHAGHILMLKECRRYCDHLTVGLHVNPNLERKSKNKPIQSLVERQIQLRGCRYVNDIIVYETEKELEDILKIYQFDVRFVGEDYKNSNDTITGIELCPIHYTSRKHDYSSTKLRERIKKA